MIRLIFWLLALTTTFGQTLDEVILPKKTEIFITLRQALNTKAAQPGDALYGRVAVPVTFQDRIILPVGTYVIGHVDSAREPGRVKGKAQLILSFDTFILPDGTTRKMEAAVHSAEEYKTNQKGEMGELEANSRQGQDVASGALGGALAGATIGAIAGNDGKGAGIGAAVGSGAGAVVGLFRKGDDVVLRKGSTLAIRLTNDVRFVKAPTGRRGTPLKP